MNIHLMKKLISLETDILERVLFSILKDFKYTNIIKKKDHYMLAEGQHPFTLVAHMDIVPLHPPKELFYDEKQKVLLSNECAGFDDRAGIYGIIKLLEWGYRPNIIFTNQEEVGGIGAQQITIDYPEKLPFNTTFFIELDRKGFDDVVFYCYEPDTKIKRFLCEKAGWRIAQGTFTDISVLMPHYKIAGANFSIGYENEHTDREILRCEWCDNAIKKIARILGDRGFPRGSLTYNEKSYILNYHEPKWYYGVYDSYLIDDKDEQQYCFLCNRPIKGEGAWLDEGKAFFPVCDECVKTYELVPQETQIKYCGPGSLEN